MCIRDSAFPVVIQFVDGKGRIVWPKEIASDAVLPFPKGHAYAP